ncbi:MAG: tetratricopeptide repeat protein [Candidatus Methanomethylophilaceae archaeon]
MSSLTVAERILLHLSRFIDYENEYDVPLDISQDGISQALRISRAHAAVELKKLKEIGEVTEKLAHVKGGKARRKSYFLTPMGLERSRKLDEFARKEGIDIMPLLDLKRCEPRQLWDSFSTEQQRIFGQACVFRVPVPRDILPSTSQSILPLDADGLVSVPENIRSNVLDALAADERREWNSFAADYWLQEGNYRERLHHLLEAGRNREACMLIRDQKEMLLHNSDDDLHGMLCNLSSIPDKLKAEVHELQAKVALEVGDRERAECLLQEMAKRDDERHLAMILQGEMHLNDGEYQEALESLQEAREHIAGIDVHMECMVAQSLCGLHRFQEGQELLQGLLERNMEAGSAVGTDLIYYNMGLLLQRMGRSDDALRYLSKGIGMVGDGPKAKWYRLMAEVYSSLGMQSKAKECQLRSKD